jgi:hypothetical protein
MHCHGTFRLKRGWTWMACEGRKGFCSSVDEAEAAGVVRGYR